MAKLEVTNNWTNDVVISAPSGPINIGRETPVIVDAKDWEKAVTGNEVIQKWLNDELITVKTVEASKSKKKKDK